MAKGINPADLTAVIQEELEAFAGATNSMIEEAGQEAAKAAKKELETSSPERTGKYRKSWKVKKEQNRRGTGWHFIVYNKDKGQLTHLLEFGHANVAEGGRRLPSKTPAHPHIEEANNNAQEVFVAELKRRIENGT